MATKPPGRSLPGVPSRTIALSRRQLAGCRNDGDFLRLAGCSEALEEGLIKICKTEDHIGNNWASFSLLRQSSRRLPSTVADSVRESCLPEHGGEVLPPAPGP